jgi:hypothetical protein
MQPCAVGCNHPFPEALSAYFHPVRRHAFSSTCACPRGREGNIPKHICKMLNVAGSITGYNNHMCPKLWFRGWGHYGRVFDLSSNRWASYRHFQKPESKNRRFQLFQKPQRVARFHEITAGFLGGYLTSSQNGENRVIYHITRSSFLVF